MSTEVIEGASLPEGIEVDETSAYFGITKSSDIVHQLMEMNLSDALSKFFATVSDIVLLPGDFDFVAASERMNCEGGEIYYLVSGHLGLMSFPDPLLEFLGLENSLGEESPNPKPDLSKSDYESLKRLADPMKILKILAIAQETGGENEVVKYYFTMKNLLEDPSSNIQKIIDIADQLDASLDVIGHALPIPDLSQSEISIPPPSKPVKPKLEKSEPQESNVSLPVKQDEPKVNTSVPLPNFSTPKEVVEVKPKTVIEETLTEKKAAKVTQEAFDGAFDISISPESVDESETNSEIKIESEPELETAQEYESESEAVQESELEPEPEPEPEVFVSAAEHFIEADTDNDGVLSVEELSQATGLSIDETEKLHSQADSDNDGKVSLSEFISSPAAEKVASLPKPVSPVRRPVSKRDTPAVREQNLAQHNQPQSINPMTQVNPQPVYPPQMNQPQPVQRPQPVNQNNWNQPVQPTIRSGVLCRGCGIGLDPYWRFCPVCGGENLG